MKSRHSQLLSIVPKKGCPNEKKTNTQLLLDPSNTSKTNPNSNLVFGVKKQHKEDHVEDLWRLGQSAAANECEAVKCSAREMIYQSTQRHPLGKSHPPKGHATLPDFVRQPDFCHGVPTLGGKESAKALLYSAHVVGEEGIRTQYVKSHNSYLPGEQRTRHYHWSINPATTVFGVKGDNIVDPASTSIGVSDALHFVCGDDRESIPLSVKSSDEDFNALSESNAYEMKSKKHFVPVSKDHVFGTSAPKAVIDTAANSIFGNRNSDTNSKHDENLGKSITPGFRNAFTETRCFGCPTIRSDIPKYGRQSVADCKNYGDDVNAEFLLRPSKLTVLGLDIDEFKKTRSKDYCRSIFQKYDINLLDQDFEVIYSVAVGEVGQASIESFQEAYTDWLIANKYQAPFTN